MPERRQIRVSRSLEGGGERPATGYGEPEAGLGALSKQHDRLKPVLRCESHHVGERLDRLHDLLFGVLRREEEPHPGR